MFFQNGRTILIGAILTYFLKGFTCNDFDPIPADLRTIIASNRLSENAPEIFAEYHALLPNFRGDYGIKSRLVEAATEDPIYKGADTFILPLYIPKGAVPFPMQRRPTRSGNPNGDPNMRIVRGPTPSVRTIDRDHLNRPVLRRIGSANRRPYFPKPQNPTPPPSFIGPWIRHRSRVNRTRSGVLPKASASEGTLSVSKPDQPKIVRKKTPITLVRKPNLRLTTLPKIHDVIDDTQSFESEKVTELVRRPFPTSTTQSIPEDKISETPKNQESSLSLKPQEDSSQKRAKPFVLMPLKPQDRLIALQEASSVTGSTTTTEIRQQSPSPPTRRRRPLGSSISLRNSQEQTKEDQKGAVKIDKTKAPPTTTPVPFSLVTSTSTSPITTPESVLFPLLTSTAAPVTRVKHSETPKSSTASPKNENLQKNAAWMLRRRATLRKRNRNGPLGNKRIDQDRVESREETLNSKPNTRVKAPGSIIDRVLSSTASQANSSAANSQKKSQTISQIHADANPPPERKTKPPTTTTTPRTLSERIKNVGRKDPAEVKKETPRPPLTRQRVPIRVRNPVVSNPTANPEPDKDVEENNSSEDTVTDTDTETDTRPVRIIPSQDREEEYSSSTNSITTSTPKLPWISSTSPMVRTEITRSSKKPLLEAYKPISTIRDRTSPITYDQSALNTPRLRSAQDIVLDKLSKLMFDATNRSKGIDDIAKELEILNQELSQLGIHIIDAEFGGHKLQLKHHGIDPKIRSRLNSTRPFPKPDLGLSYASYPLYGGGKPIPISFGHDLADKDIHRASIASKNQENASSFATKYPEGHRMKTGLQGQVTNSHRSSFSSTTTKPLVVNSSVNADKDDKMIVATSTLSPSDVTKTRTTVVPLVNPNPETKVISKPTSILDWQTHIAENEQMRHEKIGLVTSRPILNTPDRSTREPPRSRSPTPVDNLEKTTLKSTVVKELTKEVEESKDEEEIGKNIVDAQEVEDRPSGDEIQSNELDDSLAVGSHVYLFGLLGIVPFSVLLFLLYCQRRKRQEKALPQREEGTDGFTPPITTHARSSLHTGTLDAVPPFLGDASSESPWEFPRSKLRLTSIIGEGNFGMVWKAEARNLCDWGGDGNGPTVLVAVKGVKEGAGAKEKDDLLREISIMQLLGQHNNIVTLLGCCTASEPYFLVMEYVMFGRLLTFLRDHRSRNNYYNFSSDTDHLTSRDLTKFACQIASGCEYLQSRGVIHRDLAARNILVDHNKVCKIADFGLARSVKDLESDIYEQKSRGPLPIRWMAPESLFMNIFTHKSDVWSFGILCWEIVTLGSTPYPGVSAREVMRRVREGFRLERPDHCHTDFYQIITKCWNQDHTMRPSFTEVKGEIQYLLDTSTRWIDLENFQEATYYSMHENNDEKL